MSVKRDIFLYVSFIQKSYVASIRKLQTFYNIYIKEYMKICINKIIGINEALLKHYVFCHIYVLWESGNLPYHSILHRILYH